MTTQPSILISGSVAYDRIMDYRGKFVDSLLPDQLHQINVSFLVDDIKENFGGTAGNIAYNLALLEERSTILATAGKDFLPYKTWMEQHGIDASKIIIKQDKPTGAAYIMTDQGNNQIAAFHLGAMATPFPPLNAIVPQKIKYAIIAPGNIFDMVAFSRFYHERNIPYLFDPGQNIPALSGDDLRTCINGARALIANDYEMRLIEEKTGWNHDDVLSAVNILVTTLGEKGSRIETKKEAFEIPAAQCSVVKDPTGAGDAYRAGFLKGLLHKLPLDQCGKLGSVVAAYTVEQYGTQTHNPTFQEIQERFKTNFGSMLVL